MSGEYFYNEGWSFGKLLSVVKFEYTPLILLKEIGEEIEIRNKNNLKIRGHSVNGDHIVNPFRFKVCANGVARIEDRGPMEVLIPKNLRDLEGSSFSEDADDTLTVSSVYYNFTYITDSKGNNIAFLDATYK